MLGFVTAKFKGLIESRRTLLKTLAQNTNHIQDAVAAARLFGGELKMPPDMDLVLGHEEPAPATAPVQKNLFESGGEQTIREDVITHLKGAGSKGIKAAVIRHSIEAKLGRELHYKTIGMTLYRLSEKGLARRDGFTWFYVPHGDEKETPAS